MAKIIAIANQKGGVAKTTTAGAMAAGLKIKGFRVLAIDVDPQGNLSDSSKADNTNLPTCFELLKKNVTAEQTIQKLESYDMIPANIMLASADVEFTMTGKEYRLKERLQPIEHNYDYIIIDTPPSLGIMTVNAFTYANEIIIPTTADIFAATGIIQLYQSIETVKEYCNPKLKIAGILLTRFNPKTIINKDMKNLTDTIGSNINAIIFKTYIRQSIMVQEAQANRENIYAYNDKNSVSIDYKNFIDEYLGCEVK